MDVQLEFDFRVEAGFYYLGRWPIALMQAIGRKKAEMFAALQPNPLEPEFLIAQGTFTIEGQVFQVTFGADQRRYREHVFRVMHIDP